MPACEFSPTSKFPDYLQFCLIRENTGQRKPVFWHALRSVMYLGSGTLVLDLATCDPSTLQRWKT